MADGGGAHHVDDERSEAFTLYRVYSYTSYDHDRMTPDASDNHNHIAADCTQQAQQENHGLMLRQSSTRHKSTGRQTRNRNTQPGRVSYLREGAFNNNFGLTATGFLIFL